jgi:hypothetical protein
MCMISCIHTEMGSLNISMENFFRAVTKKQIFKKLTNLASFKLDILTYCVEILYGQIYYLVSQMIIEIKNKIY